MEQPPHTESTAAGLARTYVCADCNQVTRNPRLYLHHRRNYHGDPIAIHECDLCVYASKHSQKLMRHRRTVHRGQLQPTELAPMAMAPAAGGGGSGTTAANADPIASAAFPLNLSATGCPGGGGGGDTVSPNVRCSPCQWCATQAFNKATLIEHIRQAHPLVEILKCAACNYSHFDRDKFGRHQRYHTLNYIGCKICDFRTIYKWNLERHMKHHVDGGPAGGRNAFRCGKCNFTASTKQSITAHEMGHHDGGGGKEAVAALAPMVPARAVEERQVADEQRPVEEWRSAEERHDEPLDEDDGPNVESGGPSKPFDVAEFLELVWGDMAKRSYLEMRRKHSVDMNDDNVDAVNTVDSMDTVNTSLDMKADKNPSEAHMESANVESPVPEDANYLICSNCNHRNEMPAKRTESSAKAVSPRSPALMTIYRCGFCHQTSNWKHVIERHCRLLHNSATFIERYNNDTTLFQSIHTTPTKRKRLDPLPIDDYPSKAKHPCTFTAADAK